MRSLLQAALKNRKNAFLACVSLLTLFFLTLVNQCEMFAFGLMANTGVDFFTLFPSASKEVSLSQVEQQWSLIDQNADGVITKQEAVQYIANQAHHSGAWVLQSVSSRFDLENNFQVLILFLLGVAACKAFALFFSRYMTQLLIIRVSRELRQTFFKKLQSLSMSFFQQHHLGELSARAVSDAGQIASSLGSALTIYLQTPFTLITTFMGCLYLSWKLSMVIFLGLPLIIVPVTLLTRRVKNIARQLQKNQEKFSSILFDFLGGIQTIKAFAMEAFSLRKYNQQNDNMASLEGKSAKYSLLVRPILHLVATFCLAVVVLVGLHIFQMTVVQLLMFCGLLHLFYEPVKKFAEENANIQRGLVAAERMLSVLELTPQVQDRADPYEIPNFNHSIEFDKVWFRYDQEWVLQDLSFSIQKGETLALVGSTGSGKSTVLQLLMRLYEPERGEIRVDGKPIQECSQRSLRQLFSFVSQKPFLFCDTVAENISFGNSFSSQEIEAAAKTAHAYDFIARLPQQYLTPLAEMGKDLSGGEQQRIAIARALIKKAPILLMDEATSALDAMTEKSLQLSLKNWPYSSTQIIAAHRLSAIEYADRILFFEKDRPVLIGSCEKLLQISPSFRAIWDAYHRAQKSSVFLKSVGLPIVESV